MNYIKQCQTHLIYSKFPSLFLMADNDRDVLYAPNEGFVDGLFDVNNNFRHVERRELWITSDDEIKVGDVIFRPWNGVAICTPKLLDLIKSEYRVAKKVIASSTDFYRTKINRIPTDFMETYQPDANSEVGVWFNENGVILLEGTIITETKETKETKETMETVHPITPQEVIDKRVLPNVIIESVNELIQETFDGKRAHIKRNKIIERILSKDSNYTDEIIQQNNYLDIEKYYTSYGWKVGFYCPENLGDKYEAYYIFKVR